VEIARITGQFKKWLIHILNKESVFGICLIALSGISVLQTHSGLIVEIFHTASDQKNGIWRKNQRAGYRQVVFMRDTSAFHGTARTNQSYPSLQNALFVVGKLEKEFY
jgi:hypothetical protein